MNSTRSPFTSPGQRHDLRIHRDHLAELGHEPNRVALGAPRDLERLEDHPRVAAESRPDRHGDPGLVDPLQPPVGSLLCLPRSPSGRNALSCVAFGGYGGRCVESALGPPRGDEVAVSDAAGARSREPGVTPAGRGADPDRGGRRLRLAVWDRTFWIVLSKRWAGWKEALAIVEPATVIRWHREAFRRFWQRRRPVPYVWGVPGLDREVVNLIRRMSQANVTWGAPRIQNELAKLGIEVAVSTVAKYMPRHRKPPSSTWRAFLENHLRDLVAVDFFVVPTVTFGVLFGLIVLAHHRRRVVHFNVTATPTAEWTERQ